MYFTGFCLEQEAADLERLFESSLERAAIPASKTVLGPLRLWNGPALPRAFTQVRTEQGIAALDGELLWESQERRPPGTEHDLALLTRALAESRPEEAVAANGNFAALFFDERAARLWLLADSLGSRPLYYFESRGAIFFSTIQEILLRIPAIPKEFDFGAFVEQSAFCYPLGGATLYRNIRVLCDSEFLAWSAGKVRRGRYFDWRKIEFHKPPLEQAARECSLRFKQAVAERAPDEDGPARILLSGGLDSRLVAAALQEAGAGLQASTLAATGSLDLHYARRAAAALGAPLTETPWDMAAIPVVTGHIAAAVLGTAASRFSPGRLFSGDGGGETFGFLLMTREVMSLLAQGERDAAIGAYLRGHGMSARLFREPWRGIVEQRPFAAMRKELEALSHLPPQKALHLFILLNDLRRHLHDACETCARSGFALVTPFYDRRVLQSVLSLAPPLEPYLEHRLYHEIVALRNDPCFRVPWQTYPDHLPCPVADPEPETAAGLLTQWEMVAKIRRRRGEVLRRRAVAALVSGRAPLRLFHLPVLAGSIAAHKLRLADRSHLFSAVDALAHSLEPGSGFTESGILDQ